MQIYIHVPFCRQRCHYCGFYSQELENVEKKSELDFKSNTPISLSSALTVKSQRVNSQKTNSFENIFAPKQKTEQAGKKVQSLADVLRAKKKVEDEKKPSEQNKKGLTLGDVLFNQTTTNNIRQNLGFEALDSSMFEKQQNELKHGKVKNNKPNKEIYNNLKMLSGFLGQELDHADLAASNELTRSKFKQVLSPQKNVPLSLPLALPKNLFIDDANPQSKIYQVWLKALLQEIKIYSKFYSEIPVSSIYFGGGTPSIINVEDLEKIMRTLIKYFSINKDAEITLEVNPESLTKTKALAYLKLGINRISLGVQSLNDENLKSLGRVHDKKQVVEAVKILRQARFHNISLDLIWGLPGQTLKDWKQDLQAVIDLDPEHISCYGLSIEDNSLFKALAEQDLLSLPEEDEQAAMYKNTYSILKSAGFLQYEISNYAKVGFQSKHNLGYWHNEDYLGFGPSATGTIKSVRRTNAKDIILWAKDIQYNNLNKDLEESEKQINPKKTDHYFIKENLTLKDKAFEFIMLRLRTVKGLNIQEYYELTQKSFMQEYASLLKKLLAAKLIKIYNGYVSLTPNGMLISDSILEKF